MKIGFWNSLFVLVGFFGFHLELLSCRIKGYDQAPKAFYFCGPVASYSWGICIAGKREGFPLQFQHPIKNHGNNRSVTHSVKQSEVRSMAALSGQKLNAYSKVLMLSPAL